MALQSFVHLFYHVIFTFILEKKFTDESTPCRNSHKEVTLASLFRENSLFKISKLYNDGHPFCNVLFHFTLQVLRSSCNLVCKREQINIAPRDKSKIITFLHLKRHFHPYSVQTLQILPQFQTKSFSNDSFKKKKSGILYDDKNFYNKNILFLSFF